MRKTQVPSSAKNTKDTKDTKDKGSIFIEPVFFIYSEICTARSHTQMKRDVVFYKKTYPNKKFKN